MNRLSGAQCLWGLIVLGILAGCGTADARSAGQQESLPPPPGMVRAATGTHTDTPPTTTGMESPAPSPTVPPTPSASPPPAMKTTETPLPTHWPYEFTPTVWPTPTRGLPATATLSPKEDCPPPTGESVPIPLQNNPSDYESIIMDSIKATGGLDEFKRKFDAKTEAEGYAYFYQVALFAEDVTWDGTRDFLISINNRYEGDNPYTDYRTAMFIIGCRSGHYAMLYRNVFDTDETVLSGGSGFRSILDINGNGIPEVVYYVVANVTARGYSSIVFRILEWDGSGFRELVSPDLSEREIFGETYSGHVEFEDLDGNGTKEIIVPHVYWGERQNGGGVDCDFGPWLDSKTVWMWDGEHYHYIWREHAAPQYRFQAAYEGDYFSFIGFYDRAETMYLRAVFDESLKPGSQGDWMRDGKCYGFEDAKPDVTEPPRIQAYARFRLVELFTRAGRVLEAESHRSYLRVNYPLGNPGYIYAYLANVFWWGYVEDEDISAGCAAVRKAAEENEKDVFGLFEEYGYLNPGPVLENICPFSPPSSE